ncbi:MAG: hypothetical protein M1839_003523 [Geoglossum umbratile]|nr:MAG: hypothetical protein M1839_003523 [Geoglossum umbratile]
MQALQKGSLFTDVLQENWRHQLNSFKIVSFYEGIGDIVSRDSAVIGLPGDVENVVKLDANHSEICRFDITIQRDRDNLCLVLANIKMLYGLAIARGEISSLLEVPPFETEPGTGLKACETATVLPFAQSRLLTEREKQVSFNEYGMFGGPPVARSQPFGAVDTILYLEQNVVRWLCPDPLLNFQTKHADTFNRRQEGTGEWLFQDDTFKKWLDGTEKTLWCPGPPGAGKTIIASIVINHLKRTFAQEDVAITYIYCNYKERESQTATSLIGSLLQQVIRRKSAIPDKIASLYLEHTKYQTRPTFAEYSSLLQSEVQCFSKTFVIIDALDECQESDGRTRIDLLTEIWRLQPTVHLLVTSRDISTIKREFEGAARVEIRANDGDVRKYLQRRIGMEYRLAFHLKADLSLQEAIINAITSKAKGMFLLAQLYMDSLGKKCSRRDVYRALESLPEGLDGTYSEVMQRIRGQDGDDPKLAERVLYWISYAFRPLTVTEIRHALAVEPGDRNLDGDAMPDEDLLVSVCAGLVTVDRESNIIRLVHYTTQDYFDRSRRDEFPTAQIEIASACLTYLSFDTFTNFNDLHYEDTEAMDNLLQENALLGYAAQHWGDHARGGAEEATAGLAVRFLEHSPRLVFLHQVARSVKAEGTNFYFSPVEGLTGLHIAASFGLTVVVQLLLKGGADITARDDYGKTAMHRAARNGRKDVVNLLLDEGAELDSEYASGRTSLWNAVKYGHIATVELLIERGAITGGRDSSGRTPLLLAISKGDLAMVELLLEKGVQPNPEEPNSEYNPLSQAAENGSLAIVKLLLEKGADLESKSRGGWTPLFGATWKGHLAVAELLIEKGAELDCKDTRGRTALSHAAQTGQAVVKKLLRSGAELDSRDNSGRTPFSWAAETDRSGVVELLLKAGAEVDSRDNSGRTPLSRARYSATAESLLRGGAELDSRDNNGRTPLSRAASRGGEVITLLMLERGAEIDSKDCSGRTPLSWAAGDGRSRAVELLLGKGAELDSNDSSGRTPLSIAAENGFPAVVRLLLEKGAEVDSKDNRGRTPLSWAAGKAHSSIAELLIKKGAEADSKDASARTPLSWAAEEGKEDTVRLLLREGAEPDSRDDANRTPLWWAAGKWDNKTIKPLLAGGAELDSRDYSGRTPRSRIWWGRRLEFAMTIAHMCGWTGFFIVTIFLALSGLLLYGLRHAASLALQSISLRK